MSGELTGAICFLAGTVLGVLASLAWAIWTEPDDGLDECREHGDQDEFWLRRSEDWVDRGTEEAKQAAKATA